MAEVGSILQGVGSLIDSTVGLGYNIANTEYNKEQQTAQKNWAYADSRAANSMMQYYLKHGSFEGYDAWAQPWQDYNDVADYFNPFLSLSSLDLNKKAQDLAEQQFKYSKYTTENSMQIRMNDLKKAGLSPLLATGNSASYSPVSVTGSSLSGSTGKNRPGYNNIAALQGTQLASAIANIRLVDAQTKNINADTKLKGSQTEKNSEDVKKIRQETLLIKEKISNTEYATKLTQNQIEFVAQQTANLAWDYDLSVEHGIKTFDATPVLLNQIQSLVSGIGIDVNSGFGQGLVSLLMTGIILKGSGVRAPKSKVTTTTKTGNTSTSTTTYK